MAIKARDELALFVKDSVTRKKYVVEVPKIFCFVKLFMKN